jgi:hypothetical protein
MAKSSVDHTLNIYRRFADEGIARLVSDLGNPLFMPPVVLFFCCLLLEQSLYSTLLVSATAIFFYTVLPFSLTIYLFKRGVITSMDLPIRETRSTLYAFSIMSAAVASLVIYRYLPSVHPFILGLSYVFLINLSIAFILNLRWKVSVHAASVAVAGTIYGLLYTLQITDFTTSAIILSLFHLLILLPIMMWGRYHLQAHSLGELFGGLSAGIMLTILEIMIIRYLW